MELMKPDKPICKKEDVMEVLKTVNLTKTYGSGDSKVEALKGVDLTILKGEFVAIIGASGSGKSTLLHMLGGLDRPTSGEVMIDGENIYQYKEEQLAVLRRRKVGFVFQFFNLVPVLNVEENMSLPALLDYQKVDQAHLDKLMGMLGLKERRLHLPSELSGGQQQRVSIGRALMTKPAILLADEPTGNLDSQTSKEVIELLKMMAKQLKQTMIIITHDRNVADMADRVITLKDGQVVLDTRYNEKVVGE